MRLHLNAKKPPDTPPWWPDPAAEGLLKELGHAVQSLFLADEPAVSRDARSLFRRVLPDVTSHPGLLGSVPGLVASLLYSLDHLTPKYEFQRTQIAAAWKKVETIARSRPAGSPGAEGR